MRMLLVKCDWRTSIRLLSTVAPLQHREGIALTNQPDVISTGQLKRLAKLAPPEELLGTAKKRLYEMDKAVGTELKIQARLKRGNARCSWGLPQVRKHTTDKIQVLSSSLTQPLKEAIDSFRHLMSRLHPFERVVADVIVSNRERNGAMSLADALSQVKRLKSETGSALKDAAARAAQARSTKELEEITLSCLSQVESLLGKHDSVLKVVRDYGRDLRRVPVLDLKLPTVVLVGSPNVGKSSLVRAISTGLSLLSLSPSLPPLPPSLTLFREMDRSIHKEQECMHACSEP